MQTEQQRTLILGAGYAGLQTALELSRHGYSSTLIDWKRFHELKPALPHLLNNKKLETKLPLEELIKQKKIELIFDQPELINYQKKQVELVSGEKLGFDYLVIALGSEANYYGIPGLKENSLLLLDTDQAEAYLKQIETNLAIAQNLGEESPERASKLTFVVGGGGLTGVEVASELGYLLPRLIKRYPKIKEKELKIYLIEGANSLLPGTEESLSQKVGEFFQKEQSNVSVLLNTLIKEVKERQIFLSEQKKIEASSLLWTGGVRGNSFLEKEFINSNGDREKFTLARGSRLEVDQFFRVAGQNETFIVGDLAIYKDPQTKKVIPPNGQIAYKQGKSVAQNIIRLSKGNEPLQQKIAMQGVLVSLGPNSGSGVIYDPFRLELPLGFLSRKVKTLVEARYKYLDIRQ